MPVTMAGARPLLFLYPQVLRAAARSSSSSAAAGSSRRAWEASTRASRAKSSFAPRHGKGVEPGAWEQKQKEAQDIEQEPIMMPPPPPPQPAAATAETATKDGETTKVAEQQALAPEMEIKDRTAEGGGKPSATATKTATEDAAEIEKPGKAEGEEQPRAQQKEQQQQDKGKDGAEKSQKASGPLDAVLLMQAPEHTPPQHPHMSPPPYVHHFDSYSLVKQLQDGGYSQEQATTAMKGIRTLLAQNLDVAQKSLVSKSDVENVSFYPGSERVSQRESEDSLG